MLRKKVSKFCQKLAGVCQMLIFCIIWHPCQNVGKKMFFSLFLDCFSIACEKEAKKEKNVTFARKGRSGASMRESYQISNLMPCTRRARYETLERWREAMEKVQFESLENCGCSAKIILVVLAKQSLERC